MISLLSEMDAELICTDIVLVVAELLADARLKLSKGASN